MHRNILVLFGAVRVIANLRAVIVDRALIETVVMIDSRTGQYEVVGQPVTVGRDRDGEWVVSETSIGVNPYAEIGLR